MGLDSMGWFLVSRIEETHNPEVAGSSPALANKKKAEPASLTLGRKFRFFVRENS
jgi:hypothetical protein